MINVTIGILLNVNAKLRRKTNMRIKSKKNIDPNFMWIRTQYKKSYPMRNYYAFYDDLWNGFENIK
ncbi:hypothetical protein BC6_00074 [Bacillus phage BC-6]|nr:hypothetical protein BC6_00074 [Bacillus phage BC-6]